MSPTLPLLDARPRGKTHPRLASSPRASSGLPAMHFSFVKQSLHQFCIQILSRCTSNRLQVTKSYPTKRNGGPLSQGPRRRHLLECTVCERRGPCWPFRHVSASPAGNPEQPWHPACVSINRPKSGKRTKTESRGEAKDRGRATKDRSSVREEARWTPDLWVRTGIEHGW